MRLQRFVRNSISNWAAFALLLACTRPAFSDDDKRGGRDDDRSPKTLYVWSGSQVPTCRRSLP